MELAGVGPRALPAASFLQPPGPRPTRAVSALCWGRRVRALIADPEDLLGRAAVLPRPPGQGSVLALVPGSRPRPHGGASRPSLRPGSPAAPP